jgi:M6 family metalloprotease-like protein
LLAASSFVNFAALDSNGDGIIAIEETLVYFVLAGYEAASTSLTPSIWAHAWGGPGVGVAGKTINHWALNGERYSSTELMRMGTMAHEVGHAMGGLPDLYDTSGTNGGLGYFSLMSAGNWLAKSGEVPGTTPVGLDAWSRQYLGWSSPRVPTNGATLSLGSGQLSSTSAVMLRNTALSSSEYWLVENRTPVNWDEGLALAMGAGWTGGLLIQHLDLNVGSRSNNNFNRYVAGGHQGNMAEEPATAQCSLVNSSSAGCRTILFYAGNATEFGPTTTPNSNFYTGLASGFGVSNISAPSATMTATFATGGGASNEFRFGAATYSVGEATASITIPVTRTVTTGAATVAYATANGTATAGTDYTARSGTLSFAAGVATVNIAVPITNDTTFEGNETFTVSLSTPSTGTIGTPGSTTVTIVDNDVAPTVSFGAATYSVGEATASLTIPITRSSTVGAATVNYATANGTATAGTDYTARTGTASFAAGVATVNIAVPITNDTVVEGNETFTVTLSNPVGMTLGATPATTVTIVDNDVPSTVSFGAATYSVGEATASLTIPITRSSTVGAATVNYATANGTATAGTDYTARTGTASFAAGVATVNIAVPITNDTVVEGNETFTVTLSNPVGMTLGATPATTVTIVDNDVPSTVSFGAATYSVGEATASLTIPITRSSTVGAATVNYATANGTATAGTDYTARTGTASFAAGVATVNIAVPITNDTVVEGNETFTVTLSNPVGMTLGATPATTVTIVDNDVPSTVSFGAATYSVGEATASLTIPITRSSTVGAATVNYATANGTATAGTDYTARTGTASFAAGVATVNIAVPITNDTVVEGNETFTVTLSNPVAMTLGATPVTTVTIVDNDVPSTVSFGAATYSVGEATASLTIPITRSSTVGAATVTYATANGTATAGTDYTARTGTASFAAGVATVNIAVPITNDTVVEGNETFTVTLSNPVAMTLGATPVTTVTIVDNDVPSIVSFGAATYSVGEATASLTIPITRSSTVGAATVNYATANGTATAGTDYTARTGTASFAAGVATVNIAVPITNDTAAEGNETFTATLSNPVAMTLGATPVTTVTIVDNDVVPTYRLSVYRSGSGGVTSTPAGIDCVPGSACSASFNAGANVTLVATPGVGWSFNRWSGACAGTSPTCVVNMNSAKAAVAIFTTSSLGVALDNTTLPWATLGNAGWQAQSSVWLVGGSALQSGVIADLQHSIVQTTVTGPGLLTFRWRVSSESGFDWLTFGFDGWDQWYMSGESGWQQQSWFIPEGTHVLTWTYRKDSSASTGSDAGWLDEVIFTPGTQAATAGQRAPVQGPTQPVRQSFGPVIAK